MQLYIKREVAEWRRSLERVPGAFFAVFVVSVVLMNLLANKSLELPFEWRRWIAELLCLG